MTGFLMAVRILTINKGEEALVRVNSMKPITLEFPGHLVTVYEENGLIFQRVEKQSFVVETQEMDEEEAPDDNEETQYMETQIEDVDDSGETQLEDYGSLEVHIEQSEAEPFGIPYAYAAENLTYETKYLDMLQIEMDLHKTQS